MSKSEIKALKQFRFNAIKSRADKNKSDGVIRKLTRELRKLQ